MCFICDVSTDGVDWEVTSVVTTKALDSSSSVVGEANCGSLPLPSSFLVSLVEEVEEGEENIEEGEEHDGEEAAEGGSVRGTSGGLVVLLTAVMMATLDIDEEEEVAEEEEELEEEEEERVRSSRTHADSLWRDTRALRRQTSLL